MAATGKKSKRIKGKTLGIGDFLGDAPIALSIQTKTWTEEEDEFDVGQSSRPRAPVVLPSASRASRGGTYDDENVPKHPPYMAFISNLPYEVEDSTIEDLFVNLKVSNLRLPRELDGRLRGFGYVDFEDRESLVAAINIADLNVCGRRIRIDVSNSEDRRTGRRSDRDRDREYDPERTLGDWRSGTRTEKEGGGGGGGGGGSGGDRDRDRDRGDRDRGEGGRGGGDWGSSYSRREDRDVDTGPGGWRDARPKEDPPPNSSYGGRDSGDKGPPRDGGDRGFSRDGDRGFSREGGGAGGGGGGFSRDGDRGFSREGGGGGGFSREGDRGFGRDGERSFGRDSERSYGRDGDRGYGRDGDRDRGFGGFGRDGERDRDRGFGRDGERDGGFRREGFGRSFGGGYGDRDRERDRDGDRGEPRTRPKLQLLPRTVPLNPTPSADDDKSKSAKQDNGNESSDSSDRRSESAGGSHGDRNEQVVSPSLGDDKKPAEEKRPYKPPVPAASIFGAARPVDTTAREREIEERLMKKAEEMRLRDGHSREQEEKKMWSRDKKVDDFDDKRGPPRRIDDRRRDDRGRDENREERSRDDRSRDDYPRDEGGNRLPYRGTGSSREYRGSRDGDSKDYDSKESKDYRNTQDAREGRESRDGGRSSRSSNSDRAVSGNRDTKETTEKDNKEVRKERNVEERPMPKAKDHEPPNFIAQNKFSYLENADDDDASE
ncbi:uncharacterized protein LOC143919259 isoform X2 [Arctopsyche grandis]|uniref:uncharacterized protein LOC143919259 isoform X2 n=1 Tax=Arctopsyche grandis TaxID=121162 RepID=UPI00406D81AC